jgi:hypothetical protein
MAKEKNFTFSLYPRLLHSAGVHSSVWLSAGTCRLGQSRAKGRPDSSQCLEAEEPSPEKGSTDWIVKPFRYHRVNLFL